MRPYNLLSSNISPIRAGNTLEDLLALATADGTSDRHEPAALVHARLDHLRMRLQDVHVEAEQHPLASPLDGHALMALFGRPAGAWIKPVKHYLHELVIEGRLSPDDTAGAEVAARAYMDAQDHTTLTDSSSSSSS